MTIHADGGWNSSPVRRHRELPWELKMKGLILLIALSVSGCVSLGRTCAEYSEEYYTPQITRSYSIPGKVRGYYVQVSGGWERDCLEYR